MLNGFFFFSYVGFCISNPCIASQKWHQPFSYFLLQGARVFYNILQLEYRRGDVEGYKPSIFPPFFGYIRCLSPITVLAFAFNTFEIDGIILFGFSPYIHAISADSAEILS